MTAGRNVTSQSVHLVHSIRHWLNKCACAHEIYASEVLALVPVAANTGHWKKYVWGSATAVCFLYDTRLKFLENGNSDTKGAPMACSMVYWGENYEVFFDVFIEFGAVVDLRNLYGKMIGGEGQLNFYRPEVMSNASP